MQKFAVSLTIASLAVALNLQDDDEAVPTLIEVAPENTILGGDVETTEAAVDGGDDVEEDDADLFDQLDENEDGIPDIYQRVLDQYVPEEEPEEDCSCLISHGLPVNVNELGEAFITVTF